MTRRNGRRAYAGLQVAAAAVAITVFSSATASAATLSQADASALQISALSVPLIPTSHAVNDGTTSTDTASLAGALPLLPGQNLANTGLYAQTAIANDDGTSAACAGIVGSGGSVQLGEGGSCDASTTSGPAVINLPGFTVAGTGFTFRLTASSLYAVCTAGPSDSTTGFSASSTLANVTLYARASVFGIPGPEIAIPINANGSFSIPAPFNSVISLDVNKVDATGPQTSATALHIGLGPNSSIMSLDIGKVTCGDNALTNNVPMMPLSAAGGLAGTAALVGGSVYGRRRLLGRGNAA
jgi:hypothetical protein